MVANSDIYFDETLSRLSSSPFLDLGGSVLALSKWREISDGMLQLNYRIESQDAWIFQPPLNEGIAEQADFFIGSPRCDNVLASILDRGGHAVLNPAFAIRAIEVYSSYPNRTVSSIYGYTNAVLGDDKFVLFTDKFLF